jgi:SAM-dependent methyltransferase
VLCHDYDRELAQSSIVGRILDVGCGAGQALDRYKEKGWETFGVEISETASRRAQASGHSVFHGVLEEAHYPDNYFDLVRMRHVLEHLPDPVASLAETYRVLRSRGVFALEVPNWPGMWARAFKQYYWQVDSPRHLYFFDRSTVQLAVKKAGFTIDSLRTCSTLYGVEESLDRLLQEILGKTSRPHYLAWPARMFVRLSSLLPNIIFDRVGMGENLVVLSVK